tara:strand:- start:7991 stop:8782 length:792 start_codon:yes stop_codon:yes gene_type:complete
MVQIKKKVFELFGFPGSGKSFTLKKFVKNDSSINSYENILFTDFLKKKTVSYIYYLYIKFLFKNNFSNYLKTKVLVIYKNNFHKYVFINLNIEINKQYKIFKKKNPKLIKYYIYLVNQTNYSKTYKKKQIKNFKIYCSSYNYFLNNYKNSNFTIINDEGFFQKVFLDYKKSKYKKIIKNIKFYLESIPKDLNLLHVKTSINKSIKQCENRGKYFSYKKNITFLRYIFPKISKNIILFCIKNKIKYYKISSKQTNFKYKLINEN